MFKTKKIFCLIMVLLFVVMTLPPGEVTAASAVSRIGGADRYQTAVNISKQGWSYADLVVLARGDEYADALAGVTLASWYNAPILLTRGNALPDSTLNEIERLGACKVIILGGTKAVSAEVENQLKGKSLEVERIGGENRFDTAARIARKLGMLDAVFLAYGHDFPDALAAASYAGRMGYPILLTDTENIPADTEALLKEAGTVYVVGGERVISEKVFMHLYQDLGKLAVRIAGGDRYETAVELAMQFNYYHENMYAATGLKFPDAITGAVLAAKNYTGILLVRDFVPESVENYINDYGIGSLTLFGQEAAISKQVAESLNKIISGPAPTPGTPPSTPVPATAKFRVEGGQLYGFDYWKYKVWLTEAPSSLPEGDYEADGEFNFYQIEGDRRTFRGTFNYLQKIPYATMPLNTPAGSTVTASFLRRKAGELRSGTPLAGLAETYLEAQEMWGINALFLMAHSALESNWGASALARDKNNIYGFKAYDRDPYYYGSTFACKEDCIHYVSGYIRAAYLNGDGVYFKGPNLAGMNRHYATDPMWHVKVARIMQSILPYDQGGSVSKSYHRGRVTASSLNMRRAPGTGAEIIGTLSEGDTVEIEGLKLVGGEGWFKVKGSPGAGWMSSNYLSLEGPVPGTVFFLNWYLPENKSDVVNVRSGPGVNNNLVDTLSFGRQVTIVDVEVGDWMIWYKVNYSGSSGERWISGDYVIPQW